MVMMLQRKEKKEKEKNTNWFFSNPQNQKETSSQ